ncbi:MAG: VC_2705 family sodium/solute symporter, partial [Balneolales bacterium]
MVPAIYISIMMTNNPIPQIGFGSVLSDGSGLTLLDKLDGLSTDLGFAAYTSGTKSTIDVFFITAALMVGTAGLPHVIVRFFTVPKVRDARISAGYACIFIVLLYSTAPAVAAFARANLIETVDQAEYEEVPQWFSNWENTGLLVFDDKSGDGLINYSADPDANELQIDPDIMVLANPEIANLPNWVVALVAAGALAAALSTAAGLLLVISTSVAHDLGKRTLLPNITDKGELNIARIAIGFTILIAGYFGVNPPGFVAQTVAFAFGLAASSFFPVIMLGIFYKRMNKEGAIAGMITGITFTASYIIYFSFINPAINSADYWWFGISPEGIGTLGMLLNFLVAIVVSRYTKPPPSEIQELVENIRVPRALVEKTKKEVN